MFDKKERNKRDMIGMNQNDPVKHDYLQFLHYLWIFIVTKNMTFFDIAKVRKYKKHSK